VKKALILDWSPIIYGNLFSGTNEAKKENMPKEDGKYILENYKDIVIYKIFQELSEYKNKFSNNDVMVIATDNSTGGYWRKDVWEGYKYHRKDQRDQSNIQWDKAYELFAEVEDILDRCSSYKVLSVPRAEGDDIVFVLSEYLKDYEVTIVSSDHDFIQTLKHPNVKFWRTTRTVDMNDSDYYNATPEEIDEEIQKHIIQGDLGDGFGNIKHYSRFSKAFLEKYPQYEGKEYELYPKRFKIDIMFKEKYGVDAYSQPRFGYKMLKKSKKNIEDILEENKIYKLNYEMNQKLALPENIELGVKNDIITQYNQKPDTKNGACLSKYFMKNGLFELSGLLPLL
jgi:hypothetical protein